MPKFIRKQALDRKHDILSAALPLFAAKGFAATTTREIAGAAKVSDALLYKYFPSKETIYRELLAFCVEQIEEVGTRLEALEKTTASFVRGLYFLMFVVRFGGPGSEKHKGFMDRLLLQDLLEDGTIIRSFHLERIAPWIEKLNGYYLAVLQTGDAKGESSSSVNQLWFAEQLAFILQLQSLPGQNTAKFRGHERKVFEESVRFALRGLGLSEEALAKHFDPDELYEFVQASFAT